MSSARVQKWVEDTERARASVRQAMIAEGTKMDRPKKKKRRAVRKAEPTGAIGAKEKKARVAKLEAIKRDNIKLEKKYRAEQRKAEKAEQACSRKALKQILSLGKKAAGAKDMAEKTEHEIFLLTTESIRFNGG